MQINTVTQQATKLYPENPKPTCHHCKNPGHYRTNVVSSKRRGTKKTPTEIVPVTTLIVIIMLVKQFLTPTTTETSVLAMPTKRKTAMTENYALSTHPVRPVAKRTTPQRKVSLEPMHQTDRFLGKEDRWNKVKIDIKTHRSIKLKVFSLRPKLRTKYATSSLRNCVWQTGDRQTTGLSPIPEVVSQQHQKNTTN